MSISRQKLHEIKRMVRANTALPTEQAQVLHTLIDSNLELLDRLDGPEADVAEQYDVRREVQLALADLRKCIDPGEVWDKTLNAGAVCKALYVLGTIEDMLAERKLRNRKKWSWYQPRIEEEFGA